MKKIAISLLIAFAFALGAVAQEVKMQVPIQGQQKKNPFLRSISIGIDMLGPGLRYFNDQGDYQAYVQASLRGVILPVVEFGYGTANTHDDDKLIDYKANGPFGRLGFDYNILKNKLDDYRLTVGLRYGMSKFDYDTTFPTDSLHTKFTTVSENCTVHWVEIALGVDAKVWGPLHMGWSIRYRRRMGCSDYLNDPLYAPGYGNAAESTSFMGLYTIGVQF